MTTVNQQNKIYLKASIAGLSKIKQARKEKGWNLNDVRWLQTASVALGVIDAEKLAPGISYGTWKRFLSGKKPVNENAFKAYCQVLNLDWQNVVADNGNLILERQDWGEAIDVSVFFGRGKELATITNWLVRDKCSLVLLLGMGGIGKTALSIKIARSLSYEFDRVIWRSLRNAPPLSKLLSDLIQFISDRQETKLPDSIELKIALLLEYLANSRCLLILDNVESILEIATNEERKVSQSDREYNRLFKSVGESEHQSCLLLTSREKPSAITFLEQNNTRVRSLQLTGLEIAEAKDILSLKGVFVGSENDWQHLVNRYGGNPLALKIVASTIQDFFERNIAEFLDLVEQDLFICDDIYLLLQQQFERLNDLEKQVMYWLAIDREPVSIAQLQSDLVAEIYIEKLTVALKDLKNRSLIETQKDNYTQQPVVMEYTIAQLCDRLTAETTQNKIGVFNTHALIKAQAPEYIRETQIHLILKPAIEKLMMNYSSLSELSRCLSGFIQQCQLASRSGYFAGNVINILRYLDLDLSHYDFSGLTMWQANLKNLKLHGVNFAHCDLSRSIFTEALGNVMAVAFSPQEDIFATANTDGKIRLWNKKTGKIQSILSGHTNSIRCVAFDSEGNTLVSAGIDRTIKLWDVTTGECLQTLKGHDNWIRSVAFDSEGKILASGSSDCTIKLWDVTTGKCLQTLKGHDNWIRSVAFDPEGKILASGSSDCTIKLWNSTTGECLQTLEGHQLWVSSIAFSPIPPSSPLSIGVESILASSSGDRTIKLWDVKTGECLKTYRGHGEAIYAIAFSPDGKILASGSGDNTIRLWDTVTDRCYQILYGHSNQIVSLDFSADGKTLVCASLDRLVKLWDIETGKCLHTIQGYTDWAFPIAFAPQQNNPPILAGVSNDYTVRLWNTKTEKCQILSGHRDHVWSVAYNSRGTKLASCGAEPDIRVWDVENGECQQILVGHTDWVRSLSFHPGDRILASSSADGTVRLWDLEKGTASTIEIPQVWSVAFNYKGNLLATGSINGELKIWNVATGECNYTLITQSGKGIYSVAFCPVFSDRSEIIATGNADALLRLWDIKTGSCLQLAGHEEFISGVAFSPDGCIVASGSCDGTVRLWSPRTGNCLQVLTAEGKNTQALDGKSKESVTGEKRKFCSVAFSPNGKIIAAGSQNQCITLWDVASGFLKTIRPKRLYEGMNITNATGLTSAQQETLQMLGAITKI